MGLRIQVKTLREAEWIRGKKLPAGRLVVDAPVAPGIDKATLRMALTQRGYVSITIVDDDDVQAAQRKPEKAKVNA